MGSCCGCLTGPGGNQTDFGPRFDHKSPAWGQHSPARGPPPINGCQHPGLLNTRDCYVRTPMLLLSLVRFWIWPLSFLWEKVGPHMIARTYTKRPDLRDQPIPDPDLVLYTNGTSLVKQGQWLSGCAVVMEETIAEASSLPSHWSTQQAKLSALIQALQLSKGQNLRTAPPAHRSMLPLGTDRNLQGFR